MRATAITMSILGPILTFFLGAVVTAHKSNDFPWFFPLIALPLASLVYYIIHNS